MKKSVLVTVIIVAILLLGISAVMFIDNDTTELSYPSFIQAVDNQEVDSVTFKENENLFTASLHTNKDKEYRVVNPKTDGFIEHLLINGVAIEYKEEGLPRFVQIPLILLVAAIVMWFAKKNGSQNFNVLDSNKDEKTKNDIVFNDIAGNAEAKLMTQDIINFLKEPDRYRIVGARMPKGLLFYGPPGTGKTMMAKAIASEADIPFYAVSGSDFVQMYVGVGASRIRKLFQKAKKEEKAVIFIDEIDAIGKKRARSTSASNDERDQTLNALLTEMSGFNDNKGIIVIGATNRLDTLDDALLRPGRFDRQIEIGLPDVNARSKILKLYSSRKPINDDVDLDALSKSTVGFSGAMLENLLNEAAILAANENQDVIHQSHIDKAFYTVLVGAPKQDYSYISENERKITAYHEAGHALVTKLLLPDHYISKITIIPSVNGAGGFNLSIPTDTMYQSKKQLKASIQVLLGGRIAEELVLGKDEITTGASNDIQKASSLMIDYINKYGMDSDVGIFNVEVVADGYDQQLLDVCRDNMNLLYEETLKLMEDKLELLHKISEMLLENESISGEDIDEKLGMGFFEIVK